MPEVTFYKLETDETLDHLDSRREGLTDQQARKRLEEHGNNSIRTNQEVSAWRVLIDQFTSPMIYVLIGALVVTLAIQSWADAIVIALVLIVNATIGFIQEYKAETAVQSLMEMVSPKATVIRDGNEQQVDGADIVPGDVVLLNQGMVVPADMRLFESKSLQVNEAALTGESVPASKSAGAMRDAEENLPPAEQDNMAFMGTAVTSGTGRGVITATGTDTQLGQIAEQIRDAGDVQTPLQRRMDRLAKWIAAVILVVAVIAFGVGIAMGRSVSQMFLLAVSLSVAAIPAGLPVVMTVALAVGVRRMAKRHAIIRHLPAVETLGSCSTIVSDKTGTLTQNRMTLTRMVSGEDSVDVSDESSDAFQQQNSPFYWMQVGGLLNNDAKLPSADTLDDSDGEQPRESAEGDPMEIALLKAARSAGFDRDQLLERFPKVDAIPFRTEARFSASIHEDHREGERQKLVFIKGAPERVAAMCRSMLDRDGQQQPLQTDWVEKQNDRLAENGLRVLALAIGEGEDAAESIRGDAPEGMTLLGLVGLQDPPRPEAVEAVDHCHRAGIRVVMVTGDHASTAAAIAKEVHLSDQPRAYTGREIEELSDQELDRALDQSTVFARVKPDHKVRIVERLRASNQIVAVTGDGVNDAPALKSAHLGSAMGQSGTDVAKEASDMVITDDNFSSVYAAVEEGRTAFRNIRMATFFLLSTGAADVLIILSSLALRWPLPLLPAQILWCNVVTNGIADVALGFEKGNPSLYRRPPRPTDEGVLDRNLIERLALVAVWLTIGTLAVFYWVAQMGGSLDLARVSALTTLVLFQKFHVFNCRSEDVSIFKTNLFSNKVLFLGVTASLLIHVAALYLPWTQTLLHFQPLPWQVWIAAIGVAATAIIVNELHKWLRPRSQPEREAGENENGDGNDAPSDRLAALEELAEQHSKQLDRLETKSSE
jgi:Ca2+-transporting ATPase